MANTGEMQITMNQLWEEEAFWGFFLPDEPDAIKHKLMDRLQTEHQIMMTVEPKNYIANLRKYIAEETLRTLFKTDFLDGTQQYQPSHCVLIDEEPNSVKTVFRYTIDENIALALNLLFPDREIKCNWFVDGMGDYGSYTLLGGSVLNETSGNLQEDLATAYSDETSERETGSIWTPTNGETSEDPELLPF